MGERLVIQLLEEIQQFPEQDTDKEATDEDLEQQDVSVELKRRFRWGFIDELSNWMAVSHEGSEEEMLGSLSYQDQPVTLLLPGNKVVSLPVIYNKKEARHFLKLLPYQVEDDVLGSVDDLFFSVGSRETEVVTTAYVNETWLSQLLQWFKDNKLTVDCCIADYQCLQADGNELILWFTDGFVWGRRGNGLGFSVAQSLSQIFLKDMLLQQQDLENPWNIKVYVDDTETKEIIQSHIIPPMEYEVIVGQPQLSFDQINQLNFCRGKFGKKLPFQQWWQEARSVVYLAAAAVALFFITTFVDVYLIKQQQEGYLQQRNEAYRSAVPRGPITDPVRRLKSLVGNETVVQESSQSVYLLSKVAPIMNKLKIELSTLNYNNREQILRININAETFAGIEQFSQALQQEGLRAELKSSSVAKKGYQGRLEIRLKAPRNG